MLLLALDTSSPQGSLALAELTEQRIRLLGEQHWQREKSHSELVTVTLQNLLRDTQKELHQLDGVLVGVGPGSFTGIRVGVSLARALGFSLQRPVWSTNSLHLWAQSQSQSRIPVLVVMKAFRDIVYAAAYQLDQGLAREIWSPEALQVADLPKRLTTTGPLVVVGDGWVPFLDQWPAELKARVQLSENCFPEARNLFTIFVQGDRKLQPQSWKNVKPLYIRGSEAEEKLRQGLLKPVPTRQR
ncbi:MAG: tRNA (adenosine(37)-N6)-threonylcarbamoyltransferase complex dimerization subunit type 1 TsaB [Bdellovibrionales bacterium]